MRVWVRDALQQQSCAPLLFHLLLHTRLSPPATLSLSLSTLPLSLCDPLTLARQPRQSWPEARCKSPHPALTHGHTAALRLSSANAPQPSLM